VGAGAGAAETTGGASDVTGPAVVAVIGGIAVVQDTEFGAGPPAGREAPIAFGDDIISCMGEVSFFVTESAIEWSKWLVKVVPKPITHLRPDRGLLRFGT